LTGAAKRFETFGRLEDDAATIAGPDEDILFAHLASGSRRAAQVNAAPQRPIKKRSWRQQESVAVALDDSVGKAGNNGALWNDSAGDAFKAKLGLARGQSDLAGLANQSEASKPLKLESLPG
jgi:hypothetical protein